MHKQISLARNFRNNVVVFVTSITKNKESPLLKTTPYYILVNQY